MHIIKMHKITTDLQLTLIALSCFIQTAAVTDTAINNNVAEVDSLPVSQVSLYGVGMHASFND